MKYLKLFENFDNWESERLADLAAKKAELSQYSINGSKIVALESIESAGSGFLTEDNKIYIIDINDTSKIVLWGTDEDGNYDELNSQKAGSDIDFIFTAEYAKKGILEPIFNTKRDAETFMFLFKKEFSDYESYESKLKVKLKFIYTSDYKIKERNIKKEDFDKFKGRKFKIKEYGSYGEELEFMVEDVKVKFNDDMPSIYVDFTLETTADRHLLLKPAIHLAISCYYDNIGRPSKIGVSVHVSTGFEYTEWKMSDVKPLEPMVKEISKIFK